ncbi:MAG: hypothetical protein Kow00123_07100 [Anaerolineales bacterium]
MCNLGCEDIRPASSVPLIFSDNFNSGTLRTPAAGALIFADDFNDGNLAGRTAEGGAWTSPGTYMRGRSSGD